jgi:hypothetical protein
MDISQLRSELARSTDDVAGPRLAALQQYAMWMAGAGAALCVIDVITNPPSAHHPGIFHSYLFGYLFWFGVTMGSLAFVMLHHVVGGGWGFLIRRLLEAAMRLWWVAALLFIPVVIGLTSFGLYAWAEPEAAGEHLIRARAGYLNFPFWLARTVFYFAIWGGLATAFNRWVSVLNERDDPRVTYLTNVWGAGGIILYALTTTFAYVDWVMSLTPDWYSTIFGLLVLVSQGLSTLSLMLVLFNFLAGDLPLLREIHAGRWFRDLGNLTLACVMLWAYMAFSQYLITYSGNTTEEISWYLQRNRGGWTAIAVVLIALHFALPFMILLTGSRIKQNPARLAWVAAFLIGMRLIDIFWWITPTFRDHLSAGFADFGAPLLIGGIWLWCWVVQMRGRTVVPAHDPRLTEHLEELVGTHG